MSTSIHPTDTFYGVLRHDLVHSPVVTAVSNRREVVERTYREVHRYWKHDFSDQPHLEPRLVTATVTWSEPPEGTP